MIWLFLFHAVQTDSKLIQKRHLTRITGTLFHNPPELRRLIFGPSLYERKVVNDSLQLRFIKCSSVFCSSFPPINLSPEDLRNMLADAIDTVLDYHQLFHASTSFSRITQKLPLEKLIDFIFSLQGQDLSIQLSTFCSYTAKHKFANLTLSEARSKLSSELFP